MSDTSAASLALGIVGAGVGTLIGQPALGFALGSAAGAALVPPQLPDQNQPRLEDLSVTASTYGSAIPVVYGTQRIACSMIWVDPGGKKAIRHKEDAGGKGVPSQTSTWYTYSLTAAYSICAREITAVRRIWMNQKLVYDVSDTASAISLTTNTALANAVNVYTGSETQLPSALQEAYEGAGNVPAYRGLAYIEFDQLQLEQFGNGAVNVEVEVVSAGADTAPPTRINTYDGGIGSWKDTSWRCALLDEGTILQPDLVTIALSYHRIHSVYRLDMFANVLETYTYDLEFPPCAVSNNVGLCKNDPWFFHWGYVTSGCTGGQLHRVFYRGNLISTLTAGDPLGNASAGQGYFDEYETLHVGDYFIACHTQNTGFEGLIRYPATGPYGGPSDPDVFLTIRPVFPGMLTGDFANWIIFPDMDGRSFWTIASGMSSTTTDGWLVHWDIDFNIIALWKKGDTNASLSKGSLKNMLFDSTGDVGYFMGARAGTSNIIDALSYDPVTSNSAWTFIGTDTALSSAYDSIIPLSRTIGMHGDGIWSLDTLAPQNQEQLSTIVSDICARAGLGAGDINVSALTQQVNGFVIGSAMSARNAITPLSTTFLFDGAEVDGKILFTNRGGSSIKTISVDDLAAHEVGSDPPETLDIIRVHDMEIPKRVTVAYPNKNNNYQPNEQHADRLTVTSNGISNVALPVVLTDDEAATIAHKLLYISWAERETVTIQLSNKYLEISAGDILTIGDFRVRVDRADNNLAGIISINGTIEYQGAYTDSRTGVPATLFGTSPALVGPTRLVLLDVPIFRDADNSSGYYIAVKGYLAGWNGANLYKATDGSTYNLVDGMSNAAKIGSATAALPDGITNTWDFINTINVNTGGDSLASDSELNVLNGANAALLKSGSAWEVIQWVTATLEGDGTYTLSQLLRGRRGTEHATAGHVNGDTFIAITESSIKFITESNSLIDVTGANPYLFKGVSIGNLVQNTQPTTFSNTGVSLKPFSPADVVGSISGSTLTVTWKRRSRLSYYANMLLPLGEETELYTVDYYDVSGSPTLILSKTVTSPTSTLTAAEAGGSLPSSTKAVIIQQSAIVGDGYPSEVTV